MLKCLVVESTTDSENEHSSFETVGTYSNLLIQQIEHKALTGELDFYDPDINPILDNLVQLAATLVASDDDNRHFEDIKLTVDSQDISINHHDLIFAYLMKASQYELEYDRLLVAAKHGIYVQLLRMVPDVIEGLV